MMISGQRKPVQNELAKNSAIRSRSLRCLCGWDQAECEIHGSVRMDQGGVEDRKRCVALIEQHSHLRATENEAVRSLGREPPRNVDKGCPRGLGDAPDAEL